MIIDNIIITNQKQNKIKSTLNKIKIIIIYNCCLFTLAVHFLNRWRKIIVLNLET